MLKLLGNISFLLVLVLITVILVYANDEGSKEIHDNMAVYVEKPPDVEVIAEEVKEPPLYILQPIKSI